MLVQLYRDNYLTTPLENLVSTIYDGFFDGNELWFDTATVVNSQLRTSDLTSIDTITRNLFNSALSQSVKLTGFFRAKKTGSHRFFTGGNGEYILEIDGDEIIVKTSLTNNNSFANKSLIEGSYYSFNLYYGVPPFQYPPVAFTSASNTLNVTGQLYGNGQYVASVSSIASSLRDARFAFDKTGERWQSTSGRYNGTTGIYNATIPAVTTTTSGNILGEWIQLKLPDNNPIVLDKLNLTAGGTARPKGIKIMGSNTGNNDWNIIFSINSLDTIAPGGVLDVYETVTILTNNNTSYSYYRLVVESTKGDTNSFVIIQELVLFDKPILSSGYLEPLDDETNTGSTNPDDFIKNATGLTTYYDINPQTQLVSTVGGSPLIIQDNTLTGLFRISPLALYFNRGSFATSKHDILYIISDDLFNNFNGTYKNYIQLHEKPVANDVERKRFTQFNSDMSFECHLDGKIEVYFRRGIYDNVAFRYAMLMLDVEKIE